MPRKWLQVHLYLLLYIWTEGYFQDISPEALEMADRQRLQTSTNMDTHSQNAEKLLLTWDKQEVWKQNVLSFFELHIFQHNDHLRVDMNAFTQDSQSLTLGMVLGTA